MISAEISRWFNADGSFLEGMAYCQEVNPAAHRRLYPFLKAPIITPDVKEQLREALRAHAASAAETATSFSIVSYDPHSLGGNTSVAPLPEPAEVKALRKEGAMYHKQYAVLKERLRALLDNPAMYTNEDRYNVAREIMEDVIPATDAVYDRIRSFEKSGVLPASSSSEIVRDTVEKMNRLNSLNARISRIRGWLKKGQQQLTSGWVEMSIQSRAELEKELVAKEVTVKELKIQLGIDE